WVAVHVHYTKVSPPRIALKSLVTLPVGSEIAIEPSKTVVVDDPRFRVVGEIEATEPLVRAELILCEDNKPSTPTAFLQREAKRWTIGQEVTIREPEKPQKLRVVAKTDSSDKAERTLFVVYHPRLPQMTLLKPIDGAAFHAGKEGSKIRLEAQLRWPPD